MSFETREKGMVTFLPSSKTALSEDSLSLMKLSQLSGVPIYNTCNAIGTCGKCLVKVDGPCSTLTKVEAHFLTEEQISGGIRLACQCQPLGDVRVEVPQQEVPKILSEGLKVAAAPRPNIRKDVVQLDPPTLADQSADLTRVRRALGLHEAGKETELGLLKMLPKSLRQESYLVTAVRAGGSLVAVDAGDTIKELYGVAFDIGTTTVVGYLHDLNTGRQIDIASDLNPQVDYGGDVISRIEYTMQDAAGLHRLQRAIVQRLNSLIEILCGRAGIRLESVCEVTIAGNTTMHHLALGLEVYHIAQAPYIPVADQGLELRAGEIGIHIHPQGRLYCLPNIASYVGADIVGGLLACRLDKRPKPTLLLDIGTNGEMVLGCRDRMVAAASAAGPCFEGGNILFGMRASGGAIHGVSFAGGDVRLEVIGGEQPRGLCGTGLIDLVAEMVRSGLVEESGRLMAPDSSDCTEPGLLRRVRQGEKGCEFLLVPACESATGRDIVLSQRDIREVQNAKAAVCAGIKVLCIEFGMEMEEIDTILLAGAFGNYISRTSAVIIGLIPNLPLERIRSVGNAAGVGSALALVSTRARSLAERLARRVEYIELSGNPTFSNEYADAMYFPV
ncbi:MAG: DUF4445 domain-containing protein [Armatimonadetes bacterium]|nr:DUF4445 domain-containing protein [Armatimonadota bacterium]